MGNRVRLEHALYAIGVPIEMQALRFSFGLGHTDTGIAQNTGVKKLDIRHVLARNLREQMKKGALRTQTALADRTGISQSHLSEILRGITSVSLDLVNDMAFALHCQPWELLADSNSTREQAIARFLRGGDPPDGEDGDDPPPPPPTGPTRPRAAAHRTRKRKKRDSHPGDGA